MLEVKASPALNHPTTAHIRLDDIAANPEQPRHQFAQSKLDELAVSIRERGVLQPILVQVHGAGYLLHDGERRVRACRALGMTTIPALILPDGATGQQRLLNALVANAQRADMTAMEEAHALGNLRDQGLTLHQITKETGINWGKVESRLLLLQLEPEIQTLIEQDLFPKDARVTRAMLGIPDAAARVKLAQRMARPGVAIKAVIAAAEKLTERLIHAASPPPQPILAFADPLPTPAEPVAWRNVRAAARGVCTTCRHKENVPDVPEPAWSLIGSAATAICDDCALRPSASLAVCQACPAVALLKRLVASSK